MNERLKNKILNNMKSDEELFDLSIQENYRKFYKIINLITYPLLVLHELTHIFIAFILNLKITKVELDSINSPLISGMIYIKKYPKNLISEIFLSLSPFFILFVSIFLLFININFIFLLIYILVFYKISLPSNLDYARVSFFKLLKKDKEKIIYKWLYEKIDKYSKLEIIFLPRIILRDMIQEKSEINYC